MHLPADSSMEEQVRGRDSIMREYRKGNWTVQETMILIEAKKMDDERRKMTRKQHQQSQPLSHLARKPAVTELRWKWVEEYCWRKGCYRSQNQCNDKWDNLMRDYKKVRDYQRSLGNQEQETENNDIKSYWKMEKGERKDKGLPTNMIPQIYQALYDVVEHSSSSNPTTTLVTKTATTTSASASASASASPQLLVSAGAVELLQQCSLPDQPVALLHPTRVPSPLPLLPPPPQLPPAPVLRFLSSHQQQQQQPQAVPLPTLLDPETSEHSHSESPSKRPKRTDPTSGAAATTATTATTSDIAAGPSSLSTAAIQEVSTVICKSATMITEAIQGSEEREERRHREMMGLHETRLRIEESRLEINQQALHGLTDAINKLANSILTWANSHKNMQGPP